MRTIENTQPEYSWLLKEPGPRHLLKGLETYGVLEDPGEGDNPQILAWAAEIGGWVRSFYVHDEIPWCGLWVATMIKRTGRELPSNPLGALNWASWGVASPTPMLGDIMTFTRTGGGHVGFYVGEDKEAFHILGGNQGQGGGITGQVNVSRLPRSRFHKARRPAYNVQPENIRRVLIEASGRLSNNES